MSGELITSTIENCCNIEYGTRVTKRIDAGSLYPVYGGGGETFSVDSYNREDCLIISRFGMSERCTRYVKGKFFLNDSGLTVSPRDPNALRPRFLDYLILASNNAIYSLGRGTAQKNLDVAAFREFRLLYPESSYEQDRIVAILDEAFAGIAAATANAEKNLANARELFTSHLNSVFEETAEDWDETSLGAEAELLVGFAFKSAGYTVSDDGVRLLRGDNILPGSIRWEDEKRWPQSDVAQYSRYELAAGDIVLAMDRPWIKAGLKHAMLSNFDLPSLLVQRTACLRKGPGLENRFLLYLVRSTGFARHLLGVQTGIGVPHISGKQIQDFRFKKPSLYEQRAIVDTLERLDSETKRLELIYQRKLTALSELKQSILQKAFSGDLTALPGAEMQEEAA